MFFKFSVVAFQLLSLLKRVEPKSGEKIKAPVPVVAVTGDEFEVVVV